MMIMTAKVDKKKLALAAAGIVVLIVGLVLLFGGGKNDAPTAPTVSTAVSVVGNDDRVHFLNGFGWDVTDTAAKGAIRGFQMPKVIPQTQPVETTAATEPTTQPTETVAPTSKSG